MNIRSAGHGAGGKKPLFWSLLLLLALLTAANIIVYLHRNKADTFVPATYKELYHPADFPTLAGTKIIRQGVLRLKIAMSGTAGGWAIAEAVRETEELRRHFAAR